jgi:hypothetical protein
MTHPFEVRDEITVDATPDEVWEAIASGPGVDSWLMGRTEIDSASKTSTFNMFGEVSSSGRRGDRRVSMTTRFAVELKAVLRCLIQDVHRAGRATLLRAQQTPLEPLPAQATPGTAQAM